MDERGEVSFMTQCPSRSSLSMGIKHCREVKKGKADLLDVRSPYNNESHKIESIEF